MLRRVRGAWISSRFRRDRRASAIVEFAVVLPVLLTLWAGMSEMAHVIDNWRKLTLMARTVADLTAQGQVQNPIAASMMTDIFASAIKVMRPFNASNVKIVVSAMGVDLQNLNLVPRVCSSLANANATARNIGAAADLTVPPGYQTTGMRYILAEVSVVYTPMIGSALVKLVKGMNNQITLSASIPWPARGGEVYPSNTYTEVILPISPASSQKACDGTSNP